LRGKG